MNLRKLIEEYPEEFPDYAEKILDSYFGNIFVPYQNKYILYVNEKMAASIGMTKEELTGLTLEELREKKLWMRSLSRELYEKKAPFNAYNVSKWGNELFTHVEPIFNDAGEVEMSVQFSIPKKMLEEFSQYVSSEQSEFQKYKDISDYMSARRQSDNVIIFHSPASVLAFSEARHVAGLDSTVLICGETGTGKDVLANYIYQNSQRSGQPFVPVNCSAIPLELVESEFFGYERGAFTGARNSGKPGLFEMANRGTLFLDEVGELPASMQAKLLRVLESGEFMRIGGTKVQKVDVRVIAATHRDLRQMVEEGKFREDLYYSLNVMPLYLPPLRQRKEDILPLAQSFLEKYDQKYKLDRILTPEMEQALLAYDWPGNIREMRNVVERYVISGRFDLLSRQTLAPEAPGGMGEGFALPAELPLHEACAKFEEAYIRAALANCGGRMTETADRLGIHRSLLYKKLRKFSGPEAGADPAGPAAE